MVEPGILATDILSPIVEITPSDVARRSIARWSGIQTDAVEIVKFEPFEVSFRAPFHLLLVAERAERRDGETSVEGLPTSTLRDFSRTLAFIPAGHRFSGWQNPRLLTRVTYLYIDPHGPLIDPELRFAEIDFKPRLFFFDRGLWDTALKLKAQATSTCPGRESYAEALGVVLVHELIRLNSGMAAPARRSAHGGLAGWQRKRVADYIDAHLADEIPLATLAELARLSTFHFARSFKQSFGMPPHRYHTSRRIDRAKDLLAEPSLSVTAIGHEIGFSETSSFTAAFRKFTGDTPTVYRRAID